MTFLIFSCFSGLVLAAAPFWAVRVLRSRWKMPKGLFFKAGISLLIIEVIHMAAVGNATSVWPAVLEWPLYLQALVFGAAAGLVTELGRFLVLDKFMKSVRTFKEGIYFGLGWGGVSTALIGMIMVTGVIGMLSFTTAGDLAARFPDASKSDIEQLQGFQKQAADLMQGNPLFGLAPLFERAATAIIDIALTLLILLALQRGENKFVWAAVGLRALIAGLQIYAVSINIVFAEAVFLICGTVAYFLIVRIKKSYPAVEGKG
jgi:uncharacterized membrane protein YhfC